MTVGIWLLAVISIFTMMQRMMIVYKAVK